VLIIPLIHCSAYVPLSVI